MKPGYLTLLAVFACAAQAAAQQKSDSPAKGAPIFRVTVVERTVKAVNYAYRSGITSVDMLGTVLLPHAAGRADVESHRGRTEIALSVHGLEEPRRYGPEYLTYVLWAITPEGRPHNIGQLVPNGSDKSNVRVTTDLQAFALIVTAEPYSAVRQPSDVVVMENQMRPDTMGIVEPVIARYELLPRGQYTWNEPGQLAHDNRPRVSMHEFEALSEIYQAQNALGIAENAGAARYAADSYGRARSLLAQAQGMHSRKADYRQVVQLARESAQTAEDARIIAQKRDQEETQRASSAEASRLNAEVANALKERERALTEAQQARAEADAARAKAQTEEIARQKAEADAAMIPQRPAIVARTEAAPAAGGLARNRQELGDAADRQLRARLLNDLNQVLPTLDTARGLVATVEDDAFSGSTLREPFADQITRIAAIAAAHPEIHISVEGYSDTESDQSLSRDRANAVQRRLMAGGVPSRGISVAGLGNSRPVGPSNTAQGRRENSRVEIVLAGNSIGTLPLWERPYRLSGVSPH